MYTAALANASKDLEEAAIVDGANIFQQITICRASGDQKHHCDPVHPAGRKHYEYRIEKTFALQTDMNLPASEILSTYVYRMGLLNGDYGYSTAVGLFNAIINVILLIAVNWVVKKLNDGEGL